MAYALRGQVAFITGASSGIGKQVAVDLAKLGVNLVLTARRVERIEALAEKLKESYGVEVKTLGLDVRHKDQVHQVVNQLEGRWASIDMLVNNAGLALESTTIQEGRTDAWDTMIQTNINGLLYVSHAILPQMVKRNSGHVINIGSIAGRDCYKTGNIYSATKHAVRALSKSMQIDLLGTSVRVSEVAPGSVHTEFSEVRWSDKEKSDQFYQSIEALQAEDIADAVIYCLTRPSHANVSEIVVVPTIQANCNYMINKHGQTQAVVKE